MSPRRHGDAGGTRRVFKQFPELKPVPSKQLHLVRPTSPHQGATRRVPRGEHTGLTRAVGRFLGIIITMKTCNFTAFAGFYLKVTNYENKRRFPPN